MSRNPPSRPKAASGPKGPILFLVLLLLGGAALGAQGFFPSPLALPLFPPPQGLVLPSASDDSKPSPYTPTLGEMRRALAYYEAYNSLLELVDETIVPIANQNAKDYNDLLYSYKLMTLGTCTLGASTILLLIYIGVSQ